MVTPLGYAPRSSSDRTRKPGWLCVEQQLFFPEGIAFAGNGVVGTAVTAPAFNYLRPIETANEGLVDQNRASWNHIRGWLARLGALKGVA